MTLVPRGPLADRRGFTLLEVLLAVTILAVIVVLLVGILRVGLRAWDAGERRAEGQQEMRAVVELVTEALADAYPYRAPVGDKPGRVVLFEGEPDAVRFVTTAPPLALDGPAPFHAVTLARARSDHLSLTERLLPSDAPFEGGAEAVIARTVTALRLQYRDANGLWQDHWDGPTAAGLPTAIRAELTLHVAGRPDTVVPLVVPIALGKATA